MPILPLSRRALVGLGAMAGVVLAASSGPARSAPPQPLLIAVEGNPTNPASKNSYIDYTQATSQTVDQSSRMAEAVKAAETRTAQDPSRSISGR